MKPNACFEVQPIAARRSGQTLIALLVVGVILIGLYFLFLGPRRNSQGQMQPSVAKQSLNRAEEVPKASYKAQIQQVVDMYKNDNDGRPPASMEELRRYAKDYPAEMWKGIIYDPATGTVSEMPDNVKINAPPGGAPGVTIDIQPAAPAAPAQP